MSRLCLTGAVMFVEAALHADVMKSVKYMVEDLVRSSKVLLYQGQHDLIAGVAQVEEWVKTMKWASSACEFSGNDRRLGAGKGFV